MQPLTKSAEQKLIAAIEQAAEFVNDGMTPNEAIIKSAAAANIPAGHINLMVHAYNTGRTTTQREQGENTLEKSADFQLADTQTVMDALYPKAVKTSAEIVQQSVVSTEYAVSPAGMLARRRAEQEKAAAAQIALPEKTWTPPPRDEHAAAMRARSEKVAAQRAAEEDRRQATAAHTKAADALEDLGVYFRTPGNMSFSDATKQVGLRFGEPGVSVLNKIAEVYPHFKKQASTNNSHFGDNPLYGLVQKVLDGVEQYVVAKTEYEKHANQNVPVEKIEHLTGSIVSEDFSAGIVLKQAFAAPAGSGKKPPKKQPPKPPVPPTNNKPNTNSGNSGGGKGGKSEGAAEFFKGMIEPTQAVGETLGSFGLGAKTQSGMLANVLQLDKDPSKMRQDAFQDISTPDHELALKNIRAQATLHDLMLNDDVISGHDPHEVAVAFNDIAGTAPNVVEAPAVLAAMLRKRLEAGQLADFDAKQLVEMDKLKAERDEKMLQARKLENDLV